MNRTHLFIKAGFSLVEVCLAIAVVGIGLLGVFSLFPAGLQMNKRNTDATVSAMFAEDVFHRLHATFDGNIAYWDGDVADWKTLEVPITARTFWSNEGDTIKFSDKINSVEYVTDKDGPNELKHIALRYHCRFYDDGDFPRVRWARLAVWNGEFGSSNDSNAYIFTTAFYDYGQQP